MNNQQNYEISGPAQQPNFSILNQDKDLNVQTLQDMNQITMQGSNDDYGNDTSTVISGSTTGQQNNSA